MTALLRDLGTPTKIGALRTTRIGRDNGTMHRVGIHHR
jgi:hypothetical protein